MPDKIVRLPPSVPSCQRTDIMHNFAEACIPVGPIIYVALLCCSEIYSASESSVLVDLAVHGYYCHTANVGPTVT